MIQHERPAGETQHTSKMRYERLPRNWVSGPQLRKAHGWTVEQLEALEKSGLVPVQAVNEGRLYRAHQTWHCWYFDFGPVTPERWVVIEKLQGAMDTWIILNAPPTIMIPVVG